jgi:HEAT repeat protein
MSAFTWKDRDSAAHDLVQLAFHGPAPVRHSALEALQAIRSPLVVPELKQIALDTAWSNRDRSDAVYALAAMPNDIYIPELA